MAQINDPKTKTEGMGDRRVMLEAYRKKTTYLLVLFLFSYMFIFFNLGAYSLKEPDEGRYAEIPREMVEQGDYVVPHLNYARYFEKPPLLYWLTAASYKTFGLSEWSFRFPNALVALLCILITYFFTSRRFGYETGLVASLMLMSSFGFFAMSRIVTIDMLFAFLLTAALFCFYEFYGDGRKGFLYLFSSFLAMAVLAKGPVAIVLMGVTILAFLVTDRRLSFIKEIMNPWAILLFLVLAVPWFVFICAREGEFFKFFFVDQHLLRFLTTKHRRSGPLYYFVPVLFAGLFPWSIFIPRAIVRLWRAKELRLLLIWSSVVFVFFSVSGSKLPPYILPVFPALSVVLGRLFFMEWRLPVRRRWETMAYAVFFACLAFVAFAYGTKGPLETVGRLIPDSSDGLRLDLRGFSFVLSALSLACFVVIILPRFRTFRLHFYPLFTFSLCLIAGIMFHASVIDRLNTTKALARTISEAHQANDIVINLHSFDETLPFYLGRRTYLANYTGELEMGAKYTDARQFFLDQDRFRQMIRSDKAVYVVFKEKRLSMVQRMGGNLSVLRCEEQRCVAANLRAMELRSR